MKKIYTENEIEKFKSWLKENLNEEKYIHSIGTMEQAVELAKKYLPQSENKIKVAALLHDCAKCFTIDSLKEYIANNEEISKEFDLSNYKTYHAPVGCCFARENFEIDDEEILNAIKYHTVGRVGMCDFEKIVFLSDKIEPQTRNAEYRNLILQELNQDNGLNRAVLLCFKTTIKSLLDRNMTISSESVNAYNYILSLVVKS